MNACDCRALYERADWYDFQHRDWTADLPFYRRMAAQYGEPVLELACGTGRITLDLAAEGYSVTGLDLSETMLEQAHRNAAARGLKPDFICADARSFRLDRRFNLIFFPFNSISHLHSRLDIERMFRCVREHLESGGRFVVAMFVPDPRILMRDPEKRFPVSRFPLPEGGEITITESNVYDPVTQINRIRWFYRIPGRSDELIIENNMRMFYPCEFEALLHYNGFRIDRVYGDYDLRPSDPAAPMQIYVTRAAGV